MWEGAPLSSEAWGSLPEEAAAAGGVSHGNTKAVHRWPSGDGVSGPELWVRGLNGR